MKTHLRFILLLFAVNLGILVIFLQGEIVQLLQQGSWPGATNSPADPGGDQLLEAFTRQGRWFIMVQFCGFIAVGGLALIWFVLPLRRISRALDRRDPSEVGDLAREKNEMGDLARLIRASFEQRQALEQEIALRRKTEEVLQGREARLQDTLQEREALGRDLHDNLIQQLFAAGLRLEALREATAEDMRRGLDASREDINQAIRQVRTFIQSRPVVAGGPSAWIQSARSQIDRLNSLGKMRFKLEVDPTALGLLNHTALEHLAAVLSETTSNALRHSGAHEVAVRIHRVGNPVRFEIRDDGCGFDVESSPGGQGLANLRARADEIGARLEISSSPGGGTRLSLDIPIP